MPQPFDPMSVPAMPGVQPVGPDVGLSPDVLGGPQPTMSGMAIPPIPADEPLIRGEVVDWTGGKPVNLTKTLKSGKTVKDELSAHIKEVLDTEIKNHEKLRANLKRWSRLYKAEPRGARPKPWMADISIPLARKISDAIYVRVMDMVFN